MSRVALRLLLSLMLVLNGTGYAAAATQMGLSHLAMDAHGRHSAQPRHDAAPHGDRAAAMHAHAASSDCTMSATVPAEPECCQSSQCNCDCLQHATAALAVLFVPTSLPPQRHLAQPRVLDRVPPLLPHLLRPPIG